MAHRMTVMRIAETLSGITPPEWMKTALLSGAACAYLGGMAVLGVFAQLSGDLPDPAQLWEQSRPPSIQIIDRQGRDIAIRGAHAEAPIPVAELPHHVRQAVLATEDRRFYSHSGVDPYSLARAMVRNVQAGRVVEGGSTLTQQLTKNVFLTPEQTLTRKAQEMMMAIHLERLLSKDEVLRLYLSRVYFGGGAWGLEAASELYFGRPPTELSLSEAAMLVGLLQAPSAYYPVENPDKAASRMRTVLSAMHRQGLMTDAALEAARTAEVSVLRPQTNDPAEYLIDHIWPELERVAGVPSQDMVVQLSMDLELQRAAHAAVNAHLDPDRGANQGALVVLDDRGGILAMVGGRSFRDSQFNRATQMQRQPGSSFKPIVYLAALRAGLSPWTTRTDAPIEVDGWAPENFTEDFAGEMRLEDALARSINTVAVSVNEEIGRDAVVETAATLGIADLQPFASLALGAQAVSVETMARAYLPLAAGGDLPRTYALQSVATATGTPIHDHVPSAPERVLSADELRLMNRMLVRAVERGTGRRARVDGRTVAGKTGTTNDNRDAWFVGYAPGISMAVWVGDDENAPMDGITGGTIPAKIFSEVMAAALADQPVTALPQASEPDWARRQVEFRSLLDRLSAANAQTEGAGDSQ